MPSAPTVPIVSHHLVSLSLAHSVEAKKTKRRLSFLIGLLFGHGLVCVIHWALVTNYESRYRDFVRMLN